MIVQMRLIYKIQDRNIASNILTNNVMIFNQDYQLTMRKSGSLDLRRKKEV